MPAAGWDAIIVAADAAGISIVTDDMSVCYSQPSISHLELSDD